MNSERTPPTSPGLLSLVSLYQNRFPSGGLLPLLRGSPTPFSPILYILLLSAANGLFMFRLPVPESHVPIIIYVHFDSSYVIQFHVLHSHIDISYGISLMFHLC